MAKTDIIFFMEVKSNKPVTSAELGTGEKPLIRQQELGWGLRTGAIRAAASAGNNRIAYLIHKNI